MSTNHSAGPSSASCTTIIHRSLGGVAGYREVSDDASRLAVRAFPFAKLEEAAATKSLAVPACYILADEHTVYIGESGNVGRRLLEHLNDSTKAFVREVFVLSASDDRWFDKTVAMYFQYALTHAAQDAGLIAVQKGVNPRVMDLPPWRLATLTRIAEDAERLLYDAGCRAFHSNCDSQLPPIPVFGASPENENADPEDNGVMEIGVAAPPGVEEYELFHGHVWARGYWSGDSFVVAAGSDVRNVLNASVNALIGTRRQELEDAGVLGQIPGVFDRRRLMAAVALPSAAIAAKVVCGAHVNSTKWQPVQHAQPVILAV